MSFIRTAELAPREPLPGWAGRFFHTEHLTLVHYEIAPGACVHPHHHESEEVWNVVDGELEMTVDGATAVLRAGDAAVIPSGAEHAAHAVGRCRAIVVDYPARDSVGGVDVR
jgi:quercetin dioxygenase-like cupin family protein